MLALLCVTPGFAQKPNKPLKNKLPRKTVLGALHQAMDSTAVQTFVCARNTTSISVEVANGSIQDDKPYLITLDSLGITLEVYQDGETGYNEFYQYKGTNFRKVLAKLNSAKLKEQTDSTAVPLCGAGVVTLKISSPKGVYQTFTDESGVLNCTGDFFGVISYIKSLIPNLDEILSDDYRVDPVLIENELLINNNSSKFEPSADNKGVISVPYPTNVPSVLLSDNVDVKIQLNIDDPKQLRLIKLSHYAGKKKKTKLLGFTYKDLATQGSFFDTVYKGKTGVVTLDYTIDNPTAGFYGIYNVVSGDIAIFEITQTVEAVG